MKKYIQKIMPAVLCFAVLLTSVGCQNTGNITSDTLSQEPELNVSQESGAVRTVSTVMGDIEVPADPQRVVVNWYVGDAYALDLNVVGYFAWEHESMPFYDELSSAAKIMNWEPEEVMTLDPDLIITYKNDDFEKFKDIAPVLVIPEGDTDSLERVQFIGEATGRSEQAEAVVETFERKLAAAKEKLQSDEFKDKTFSINEDWGSGSYGVYYETGSRGGTLVYEYLGLKKPEKLEKLIAETGEGRGGLSYEVAAEYFGDYMIWFRPYDSVEDVQSEYETTDLWNTIPAVQKGKVIVIPGIKSGLFYYSDVLSLTAQLDYIVDAINSLAD